MGDLSEFRNSRRFNADPMSRYRNNLEINFNQLIEPRFAPVRELPDPSQLTDRHDGWFFYSRSSDGSQIPWYFEFSTKSFRPLTSPISWHTQVIGDGTNTQFHVVHNLNTWLVFPVLWEMTASRASTFLTECDFSRASLTEMTLFFSDAPSLNAYEVVIVGLGSQAPRFSNSPGQSSPQGSADEGILLTALEDIPAGAFVNFAQNGVQLACANSKPCDGYVLIPVLQGATAQIYVDPGFISNPQLVDVAIADYFLSEIPGKASTAVVTAPGHLLQRVGTRRSGKFIFDREEPISRS